MAIKYKILGQASPSPNSNITLYTVPAGNSAVISTVNICNMSTTNVSFRLSACKANVANAISYIAFDTALPAQDSIALTLGITLDATDTLTAYSFLGNVSFNVFGSEIY